LLRAFAQHGRCRAAFVYCVVSAWFRVVQSIFPDWKFAAADTVAANAMHGALLVGPRHDIGSPRANGWTRWQVSILSSIATDS
jgi:hypothetical protein